MVKVKFCGITRLEDALDSARLGVHAIGFVFVKKSPRYITPKKVCNIITQLPPLVLRVGVFMDENIDEIKKIISLSKIDIVQLHGQESPQFCKKLKKTTRIIKALRVKDREILNLIPKYKFVDAILLDSYDAKNLGGSGKTFDWDIAREARKFNIPVILSGGLNPDNVKEAIREVNPYAVDVSSGIEHVPGIKDHELMARFIASVWEEEWGM